MTKIIGLANSCKDCPNRHYYSSGAYECALVQNSRLNADNSIPGWCPLPNYPTTLSTETVDKPVSKPIDLHHEDWRELYNIAYDRDSLEAFIKRGRALLNGDENV